MRSGTLIFNKILGILVFFFILFIVTVTIKDDLFLEFFQKTKLDKKSHIDKNFNLSKNNITQEQSPVIKKALATFVEEKVYVDLSLDELSPSTDVTMYFKLDSGEDVALRAKGNFEKLNKGDRVYIYYHQNSISKENTGDYFERIPVNSYH